MTLRKLLLSSFIGLVAIGCGVTTVKVVEVEDEDAGTNTDTTMPPASSSGSSGGSSGKTSSSSSSSSSSGGSSGDGGSSTAPAAGDKCTKLNQVFEKVCGKCGKHSAICLDDGAGGGKVSEYGACQNEIGQCVIGSTQECGNCGTSTCSNSCNWGVCNQPATACPKGQVEYTTAGCAAGQYRSRTCSATCQWGTFSVTCAEPDNANKLVIGAAGATATGSYTLAATRVSKRAPTYTSSCNASGVLSTTTDHPYEIIELRNPTAQTAKVTVTVSSSSSSLYMVLAAYPNNLPPQSDTDLKTCTMATTGYSASLYSVTIGPNARVVVRPQAYYSAASGSTATGTINVSVKTDSLQ